MKKDILGSLAWAAAMILSALAASYGRAQGYIDQETVLRVVAMNGLYIAYLGNSIPKKVAPSVHAQKVNRFAGWVLVISGLIYAGFWALAPLDLAMTIGTGAVAVGAILTLGYCLGLRSQTRAGA
ncbi:ammonium transporter [Asticcacaulis machinosus]|uniref:Ammonium transporter n=1 Tax=Asticcacaulis machinosus TaxID=2984211 RepID=A0ABT5HMJ9_9CAUL|nr:ammonium transporter [Asticcacaulis machinosus]MDC7677350.1 ammonium transporter [Asticcacaulis machinosus]